ncbi:MAG TPA: M67 family metallopeptidase [Nitrosopumilaceae archaeon]|nr:M67 family metallopeptidase [Nitrosopumilaceae archaeon]
MQIILSKNQKDILVHHAKKCAPSESCALLFGKEDTNTISVSEVFLAENVEDSPINFTIANEELLKGYQIAEAKKLDVIGIFHSHPHSEAIPSSTDRKFMQVNPVVWVIFSNKTNELKAYALESEIVSVDVKIA